MKLYINQYSYNISSITHSATGLSDLSLTKHVHWGMLSSPGIVDFTQMPRVRRIGVLSLRVLILSRLQGVFSRYLGLVRTLQKMVFFEIFFPNKTSFVRTLHIYESLVKEIVMRHKHWYVRKTKINVDIIKRLLHGVLIKIINKNKTSYVCTLHSLRRDQRQVNGYLKNTCFCKSKNRQKTKINVDSITYLFFISPYVFCDQENYRKFYRYLILNQILTHANKLLFN